MPIINVKLVEGAFRTEQKHGCCLNLRMPLRVFIPGSET